MTTSRGSAGPLALLLGAVLAFGGLVAAAPSDAASSSPTPRLTNARGTWRVAEVADGRYRVTWKSARTLPTTSDRPTIEGSGLSFGPPRVARDRRTVSAYVAAPRTPDPAKLDVVLSGDRLDEPGNDGRSERKAGLPPARATSLLNAADPATPGPYDVTTSDYRLDPVKVAGMRTPIEMVGHVVEPTAGSLTGPRPLVLFLHGRHSVCYVPGAGDDDGGDDGTWPCAAPAKEIPSELGYQYVQQVLASQGYTTVSIRTNGINAQDGYLEDGGAAARAVIVEEHLKHWVGLATAHQVDLKQVVLVGHSRGGEGVDRASITIPLSAPYRIVGQVLIAPVDFSSQTAPYVPTVTLLPYCDGDVYDLQGQRYTDIGRDLDPADKSFKSSVLVMGANHNYFNSEWTPGVAVAPAWDDWSGDDKALCGTRDPGRLTAAGQRDVGTVYIAGAVKLFTGDGAYLPLFDGSAVTVPSIAGADVRSHAVGGGRQERRPGFEATPTVQGSGAETQICTGRTAQSSAVDLCGRDVEGQVTPHWVVSGESAPPRRFLEMAWDASGATGGLRFGKPLDLSADRLELRTIVDPDAGPVQLRVRIGDGAGNKVTLTPEGGSQLDPFPGEPWVTKLWAQAVLVDARTATGVDLTDIRSVELVADNDHGRVWVADVAAAPAVLAVVPATRLPQIDIGSLTLDEGNGEDAPKLARVPFTITGTVTAPARISVTTIGEQPGARHRFGIEIAPGQTSGTIPIEYRSGNVSDDYDQHVQVQAYATRMVTTGNNVGGLTVRDDDPDAVVTIKALKKQVTEGGTIVFRVATRQRTGYPIFAYVAAVNRGKHPLRGTDVPAAWLRNHSAWGSEPGLSRNRTLASLGTSVYGEIPAGPGHLDLRVPTLKDRKREGTETLTMRFYYPDGRFVDSTVTVRDRT